MYCLFLLFQRSSLFLLMLFSDTYMMLSAPVEAELKDKGSKFLAYAFPVRSEEEAKQKLLDVKKEHAGANHHCYAYVLGFDGLIQKANDDREPSNTAGKPILRAILSKQLTNIIVIVVRYFGGRLLGVPGLIQAYGGAANLALASATLSEQTITERHQLVFDYAQENDAFRLVKQFGLKVQSHIHAEKITIIFEIRKSEAEKVIQAIREHHLFETTFVGEQ
jgi:uncharacterized YigZ family protein